MVEVHWEWNNNGFVWVWEMLEIEIMAILCADCAQRSEIKWQWIHRCVTVNKQFEDVFSLFEMGKIPMLQFRSFAISGIANWMCVSMALHFLFSLSASSFKSIQFIFAQWWVILVVVALPTLQWMDVNLSYFHSLLLSLLQKRHDMEFRICANIVCVYTNAFQMCNGLFCSLTGIRIQWASGCAHFPMQAWILDRHRTAKRNCIWGIWITFLIDSHLVSFPTH